VAEAFPALARTLEGRQPCLGALEDGRVASVCYVAARSARAAEAGVETLPGFRGRGLAARATAAWARAVADVGLIPLYSTEWRNRSSRGVAARLGLILYGVDLHFR
jgi:predicted GNAT family acetyltransferase